MYLIAIKPAIIKTPMTPPLRPAINPIEELEFPLVGTAALVVETMQKRMLSNE